MNALGRLLRIAPGEGMKVLQFALLGLLLQAGLTVGINAGDSLFLARVGADKLPHIYILVPLLMLLYIPTVTAMLRRFGIDRVLDATMAVATAERVHFMRELFVARAERGLCRVRIGAHYATHRA